mmetsp:Transcript_30512/g.76331  ORF Transcript_30512/g.76331 Transcript_30512/m.76331 type:complete len:342 (+) Transcript_30512:94-1119(+)
MLGQSIASAKRPEWVRTTVSTRVISTSRGQSAICGDIINVWLASKALCCSQLNTGPQCGVGILRYSQVTRCHCPKRLSRHPHPRKSQPPSLHGRSRLPPRPHHRGRTHHQSPTGCPAALGRHPAPRNALPTRRRRHTLPKTSERLCRASPASRRSLCVQRHLQIPPAGAPQGRHGPTPESAGARWLLRGAPGHPCGLQVAAGRLEPPRPWPARPPESGGAWRGLREAPRELRGRPWRQHAAGRRGRQLPPQSQEGCERCGAATRSWGSPAGAMRPYGCLRRPAGRVAAAARHGGARPEGRWVPVRAKPSSKRPSPCRPSCGPLSQVPLAQGKEQWRCEGCS